MFEMLYLADEMFRQKDKEIRLVFWQTDNHGKPLIKHNLHWNGPIG